LKSSPRKAAQTAKRKPSVKRNDDYEMALVAVARPVTPRRKKLVGRVIYSGFSLVAAEAVAAGFNGEWGDTLATDALDATDTPQVAVDEGGGLTVYYVRIVGGSDPLKAVRCFLNRAEAIQWAAGFNTLNATGGFKLRAQTFRRLYREVEGAADGEGVAGR